MVDNKISCHLFFGYRCALVLQERKLYHAQFPTSDSLPWCVSHAGSGEL